MESDTSVPIKANRIRAGVYSLSILVREGKEFRETGIEAWILVTTRARYKSSYASFGEALALTRSWGNQVKPDIARGFLRASLEVIAHK